MAFDVEVLRRLGGFDPAMGAGTFARGGDDLAGFFRVVVSGHLYQAVRQAAGRTAAVPAEATA